MKKIRLFFLFFSAVVFLQSCNTTKNIPTGDKLYTGAEIELKSEAKKKFRKRLEAELNKKIRPKANSSLFGWKLKLGIYNAIEPKKPKGLKAAIRKKLGEPPVLYSTVNPVLIKEVFSAHLFNRGFFHGITTYRVESDSLSAKVIYIVNTGPGYRVRKYRFATPDTTINKIVNNGKSKAEVKLKRRYNLEKLKDERERADKELKNNGYYYFNADYLEFEADTSEKDKSVSLKLTFKDNIPEKSVRRYTMRKVVVQMDSSAYYDSTEIVHDTLFIDSIHIHVARSFNPKVIARYVYLKENHYYSREDHQLTLSRLMGMGLFRFVNLQIKEADSLGLVAYITLAPLPKKSFSGEIQAVTKSNNFVGPRASVSHSNRNLVRGGERLSVNMHGSFETQISGKFKGLYTYEIGPSVQLRFPRFISPFRLKTPNLFTPSTTLSADYDFTRRINYFDMNSFKFSYAYRWKESDQKEHEFFPASITYFTIKNISEEFQKLISNDLRLQRRYEDQFISSLMYAYTYNEQTLQTKKNQLYFNGNLDVAGNLAYLASTMAGGVNEDGTRNLAGVRFAQYAKIDGDFRNYHQINTKTQLVTRVFAGWGLPYGNSEALPYIKSYFAGGANSIRAFTVNTLGPGTYRAPNNQQGAYFIQQGGDIKLEFNAEYRFPFVSVVKGAVFVDAGNTWLYRENEQLRGGEFRLRNVPSELAIGGGVGVRVDLSFFVIRLDVATPFRKPWLPVRERWTAGQFNITDKEWRGENIIFNIAIGYPF